ncbi:histidine triad nucleotide-binding protein [Candidatus Peregrinibacteria bacterium]|nr:MAG: histidine triad nucleotide-binding protein [Candidatus Peregrinibacteria bacterium]
MEDCIFCKISEGSIPAKKVYEDEFVLAFHDIHPKAKTHILVVPKAHTPSLSEAKEKDEAILGKLLLTVQKVAKDQGLSGYKVLMNVNREGGQVVFHLHLHLLGGGKIDLEHC